MGRAERLITENLGLWSAAVKTKSSAGRGSNKKAEFYGVTKLRELILDLAVRGMLVEQNTDNDSAEELLEQIANERSEKDLGRSPKKKAKITCIPKGEEPYPLPEGWAFARFGEIYTLDYGKNLPSSKRSESGEYPVYGSNGIVGTHSESCIKQPCIIVGRKGSAGALNICRSSGCWVTDVAYSVVPPSIFCLDYVFIDFKTLGLDKLGKGIKPGLSRKEAYNLITRIPPLTEQYRIVAKVDELMQLCDQLEEEQEKNLETHETLVSTLLSALTTASVDASQFVEAWKRIDDNFDILFTTENSVDQLKQTILQLAVMGKLVPQDPEDESADKLLLKIAEAKKDMLSEGKIKKQKRLPEITLEECEVKLPNNWIYCRLNDLIQISSGDGLTTANMAKNGQIPVYGGNGVSGYHDQTNVSQTTLTIGRVGYYCGAVHITPEKAWVTDNAFITTFPEEHIFLEFLALLLKATDLKENENATAQPVISGKKLYPIVVGLPPHAEQHRIVAKVDELMSICDQLKASLASAQDTQLNLADSLVEQAIN